MPRQGSRIATKDNEVVRRLKAGNGKINGLKMLAAVDDQALMPVEVVGIDFDTKGYDDRRIAVHVTPVGGHGKIWVGPSQLLDNTPASVDLFDRKCKAAEVMQEFKNARSDKMRRSLVIDTRVKMNPAQRKTFDELIPDRIGEKAAADPVAAINRVTSEYELERVLDLAVKVLFDLVDAEKFDD